MLRRPVSALTTSLPWQRELEASLDAFSSQRGGTLDEADLRRFLPVALPDSAASDVEELAPLVVQTLDADGSGTVQRAAVVPWVLAYQQQGHVGGEDELAEEMAPRLFALFDPEGEGRLSRTEFSDRLDALGIQVITGHPLPVVWCSLSLHTRCA